MRRAPDLVACAYRPRTLGREVGESEVQACSWLHSEHEASLGYSEHKRNKKNRIETLLIDNHTKLQKN